MSHIMQVHNNRVPSMSIDSIDLAYKIQDIVLAEPQVNIHTDHSIHAGVYTRTIMIPKGVTIVGALIKISTNLIVNGHVHVFLGDHERELKGYNTLYASANRKQAFIAKEDTYITMFFATSATSVEEAEKEFTDDHELLMSNNIDDNTITLTGE